MPSLPTMLRIRWSDKAGDFNSAAFGISGLETALPVLLSLVHEGQLELSTLIARLTSGPAKVLSRAAGMSVLSGYPVPEGLGTLQAGSSGRSRSVQSGFRVGGGSQPVCLQGQEQPLGWALAQRQGDGHGGGG